MSHPSPERLRRFVLADLLESEELGIERHLKTPCERCLFDAREMLPEAQFATTEDIRTFVEAIYREDHSAPPAGGDELDPAGLFDRLARQALRRRFLVDCEAVLAPALIAELERRPPRTRREVIRTSRRYQLYGLAEWLCEASRAAGFSDVARALELGKLAVVVADSLDARLYPLELLADRQALCRVVGQFQMSGRKRP